MRWPFSVPFLAKIGTDYPRLCPISVPILVKPQYLGGDLDYPYLGGGEWTAPYVTGYPIEPQVVGWELVPHGELAIHRGDPVRATDGQVGVVGEFIVDADSGHISHLVLQKGHLWGKREVTLGLDLVDRVEESVVYLKVGKKVVEQLPAVKVKRHYRWQKGD